MSIVPAAKNHPVGADATVVGVPQLPCRMTRPEFMQALERSGYGERDAVYRTFFHRADDGSPLCNTCGLPIGHHSNSDPAVVVPVPEPPSSRRGESEIPFPPPDCTIQQYCNNPKLQHPYVGAVTPYPPHWVGAAWYASLIEFVGHSRNETTTVHYGGKNPHSITTAHALLKYRCTIDGCGKVFEVEGPVVDPKNSASAGPVFLRTMGNGESIEAHMSSAHGLKHLPAGRFATRLFDCCNDPMFAINGCIPNAANVAFLPFETSVRVFASFTTFEETEILPGHSFVYSTPLNDVQCDTPTCCFNFWIWLTCQWYVLVVTVSLTLFGVLTLFGIPCNDDCFPPLPCFSCYYRRRRLVQVLGADESPACTRAKATFCCYCSEVQVRREIKASGVWPGLLCCEASKEDREYMKPSKVRQRYSVDGAYAVRATSVAGGQLLRAVRERTDGPPPNMCYRMT
jgi:hypothetical protein